MLHGRNVEAEGAETEEEEDTTRLQSPNAVYGCFRWSSSCSTIEYDELGREPGR